jgi:UDP-N-acetylmuramoylalanine--D-glutamate ligase
MEEYVASKETIVNNQQADDVAVLPIDDPAGERFAARTKGAVRWFGIREGVGGMEHGAEGLFRIGDDVVLRHGGREERVLSWEELGGTGDHTKRNMLAGALLALEMGAPLDDVRTVLRTFRGIPNRLEGLKSVQERAFVNDTTATTPEAVIAALHAFPDRMVVLITGGTDKNLDYTALAAALTETPNLRAAVFLAGSATDKLCAMLGHDAWGIVRTMAEAVDRAWQASQPGDVILLSPGAASFELFRDEFDRGSQFWGAVAALARDKTENASPS